ncbi:proline dehydrogenase family protein [Exiguobacterium sp. MMG028]|uniref:proline dehydrogenase family protein n=1 Tax=Exiguobacterium sp. MMG028 TaxID=3021979 RepID=UPI0022FE6F8F|nr:proline dehydrogenase family protein [Exiguobacterium sp. MMG028]
MTHEEKRFVDSLKSIARNQDIKSYIQNDDNLYRLFLSGAKRFVAGEKREDGIERAIQFQTEGHRVSLEFIGENTMSETECNRAKNEFLELMIELGKHLRHFTISLDLSHIGMMVSDELAISNLLELAIEAKRYDATIMISMEESAKTERILSIYNHVEEIHSNIGVTLQVHLKRTEADLLKLVQKQRRIRLVKGAYQEDEGVYTPRSNELNDRYVKFVEKCQSTNQMLSLATHDVSLLNLLEEKGLLRGSHVEVEMLDGVQSELLNSLKQRGISTKKYVTYGTEWYLYVVHRIAEHPSNIYTFISDVINQKTR